jgi:hypothetical protein
VDIVAIKNRLSGTAKGCGILNDRCNEIRWRGLHDLLGSDH